MTIEEKARAYDETLDKAKKELDACGSQDCDAARQIFRLFPELAESEDKKIQKELISFVRRQIECHNKPNVERDEKFESWIDWLEKQGEQKYSQKYIDDAYLKGVTTTKRMLGKQGKAKWCEEDEQYLLVCKNALYKYQASDKWDADIIYSWLENKIKQRMEKQK